MKKPFAKRIQDAMSNRAPKNITDGTWRGRVYQHICLDKKYNFIDGKYPHKCDVKGNLFGEDKLIKYHLAAAHLTSSQAVCINFFKKFFEQEPWEDLLIKALKQVGVPLSSEKIKYAVFEYEPNSKEHTNFDFYMVLEDDSHISMEIKYTEAEFGGISPDKNDPEKYHRKWQELYKNMVAASPFLTCTEDEFYAEYQINRNISFATEKDIVLFLTPRANDAKGLILGRSYIDSLTAKYPCIKNIYWEDLVAELMKLLEVGELRDYYKKFSEKYIAIL